MMDACHYTFVQSSRMYNTKNELSILWILGDYDVSGSSSIATLVPFLWEMLIRRKAMPCVQGGRAWEICVLSCQSCCESTTSFINSHKQKQAKKKKKSKLFISHLGWQLVFCESQRPYVCVLLNNFCSSNKVYCSRFLCTLLEVFINDHLHASGTWLKSMCFKRYIW